MQENLEITFETNDNDYCRIHIRSMNAEVDKESRKFHEIVSDKGNSRGGSVCLESITSINSLYILESRSFQSVQGCFSDIRG